MSNYITEYQFVKLFAWLIYSVGLWIFSRYWFENFPKKRKIVQIENIVPPSTSAERLKTEQLMTENRKLNTENERLKGNSEQQKAEIEQLKTELEKWKRFGRRESENLKAVKAQNDILFEALNRANQRREVDFEEEAVPAMTGKPENGATDDFGTTTDEFEAMVEVMKGRPRSFQKFKNKPFKPFKKRRERNSTIS